MLCHCCIICLLRISQICKIMGTGSCDEPLQEKWSGDTWRLAYHAAQPGRRGHQINKKKGCDFEFSVVGAVSRAETKDDGDGHPYRRPSPGRQQEFLVLQGLYGKVNSAQL